MRATLLSCVAAALAAAAAPPSAMAQSAARLLLHPLSSAPLDVAVSPDGRLAIVRAGAGADAITFYRLSDGVRVGTFLSSSSTTGPRLVAFAPDSASAVALGGAGGDAVMFFNTSGAVPTLTVSRALDNPAHDVAVASDSSFAVVVGQASAAGEGIAFYSLPGGVRTGAGNCGTVAQAARLVAISPDHTRAVIVTATNAAAGTQAIQLWNTFTAPQTRLAQQDLAGPGHDVAISPDSRFAAIHSSGPGGIGTFINNISTATFSAFSLRLPGGPDCANSVAVSSDGSHAAFLSSDAPPADSYAAYYDTTGPTPALLGIGAPPAPGRDVALSPDGRVVAWVTDDDYVVESLVPLFGDAWFDQNGAPFPARTADLIAFTADSTRAALCRPTDVFFISTCHGAFRQIVPALAPVAFGAPHQLRLSPDSRFVAIRAGAVPAGLSFYSTVTAAQFSTFAASTSPSADASNSLAISPDSRTVIALGGPSAAVDIIRVTLPCRADFDGNGRFEPADVALFVNKWFADLTAGTRLGDFDGNCAVQPADVSLFVSVWYNSVTTGAC